MKCFIEGCNCDISKSISQGGVSSHRFPSSEKQRQKWITAIRILTGQEIPPATKKRICGNHFLPDEFQVIGDKLGLKKGTIPSVFPKTHPLVSEHLEVLLDDDDQPEHYAPAAKKSKTEIEEIEKLNAEHAERMKTVKQKYKRKIRMLQQKYRRLQCRLKSMEELFSQICEKNMLSQPAADHLKATYGESDALLHALQTYKRGKTVSEQLRTFAITLHFYSPRAYIYVRQAFQNRLPHPRSILRWYTSVEGEPGLTAETMAALEVKAKEHMASGKRLLVGLMMDEVAIRRHTEWNDRKKCFEGVVQYSGFLPENSDELPVAKEALVLMVTGVTENWKIPIAYFLSDSMDTDQKASLIENILAHLHSINVNVISFTFDGTSTNFSTANKLGACLKSGPDLKSYFSHPISNEPVFIILDPSHMLKLVRNTLAAKEVFNTDTGQIRWEFIQELNKTQNLCGTKYPGKLSDRHVNFKNEKMRVDLAAQTLSRSVAKNIKKLSKTCKAFSGSKETVDFITKVNDVFDVMNSKHPDSDGYKKPMSVENIESYTELFSKAELMFKSLKIEYKKAEGMVWSPAITSINKTGFLGFVINMRSFLGLYKRYVEELGEIDRIYGYRFSQDHLETFFSAIRARGGFNNNPTAVQFKAAYKRLLLNNAVRASSAANCNDFDEIRMVHINDKAQYYLDAINSRRSEQISVSVEMDLPNNSISESTNLDDAIFSCAIANSANTVHKNLIQKIKCGECLEKLTLGSTTARGTAQDDILTICKSAERAFKSLVGDMNNFNVPKYYERLVINVQRDILESNVYSSLSRHILEQDGLRNHRNLLIKLTIELYLKLRLENYSKSFAGFRETLRKKLTKLILFKGD